MTAATILEHLLDPRSSEALVDAMVRSAAWQGEATRRRWQVLYLPRREFEPFLKAEIRSVRQTLARLGLVQPRQLP